MTRSQARVTISLNFLVSWVLRLATASILVTAAAKGTYALVRGQSCGLAQSFCNLIQDVIAFGVNKIFFLLWIWNWLPDVSPEFWYLALLSSTGLCAAFFLLFAFFLDRERRDLSAALKEVIARARVQRFNQNSNSQSVGSITAGRDVNFEQIINNSPEIRGWENTFSKSPFGQIIIAAVGGFLAFLLGKLIGN